LIVPFPLSEISKPKKKHAQFTVDCTRHQHLIGSSSPH
jgi:hypothetical protein